MKISVNQYFKLANEKLKLSLEYSNLETILKQQLKIIQDLLDQKERLNQKLSIENYIRRLAYEHQIPQEQIIELINQNLKLWLKEKP